ncbi:MAG: hypothetical protein KA974_07615 [Saprospiraceae bacterium]|nr:hypothetical protein [Saprospiraceae bacterium]MBP7679678.1 hypothetical protein [Saprospiraceae bacterium]
MLSRNIVLSTLISLLLHINLSAQQYFDYEWEHYCITVTFPEDFKASKNTADEFEAIGDGMEFALYPFNDQSISEDDIAAYTVGIAESVQLQEVDDANAIALNGLKGACVEEYKDGSRVFLSGLIDTNSATNFFALITFGDATDNVAQDEAVTILKSLRRK